MLLKNANAIFENEIKNCNVLIDGGKIVKITQSEISDSETVDVKIFTFPAAAVIRLWIKTPKK